MSLQINLISPKTLTKPINFRSFPFPTTTHFTNNRPKTQIPCTKNNNRDSNSKGTNISNSDLASELAREVAKINTQLAQKEEAMKKSKELLFTELCNYMNMDKEQVKRKWISIDQEERFVLIKAFVNDWSVNFHPLSAKSVKELIEEYLHDEKPMSSTSRSSSSYESFPGFRRLIGFFQNK